MAKPSLWSYTDLTTYVWSKHRFVLLTYLLSETEIPCHLTLQMLKNRNKVNRMIKLICLMADQSPRFNFYISSIKRTTKLQLHLKKEREFQQFQVCASTARWMGSIANRGTKILQAAQVTKKKNTHTQNKHLSFHPA